MRNEREGIHKLVLRWLVVCCKIMFAVLEVEEAMAVEEAIGFEAYHNKLFIYSQNLIPLL